MKEILIAVGVVVGIGIVLGALLAIADKYLSVKEDERVVAVLGLLPGANCGGCGFPGCPGFAAALVEGKANKVSTCRPSKPDNRAKIVEYLAKTPGPDGNTVKVDI